MGVGFLCNAMVQIAGSDEDLTYHVHSLFSSFEHGFWFDYYSVKHLVLYIWISCLFADVGCRGGPHLIDFYERYESTQLRQKLVL